MIVRSDVSVYQIFRRFRLRKLEFPGCWIAKPLSYLPIPFPFLFFLTPFSFPSISYFFLLHLKVLLFALSLSLSHVCFFFLCRFLGNWLVASNSAQGAEKEARGSIPLFLLLCLWPRRNFRIWSCLNFFFSYTISVDSSFLLVYRVAKLIRLASSSRPLDRRRATL